MKGVDYDNKREYRDEMSNEVLEEGWDVFAVRNV